MIRARLTRCRSCGVPQVECLSRGLHHTIMNPPDYIQEWTCQGCLEEASLRCSHCDTFLPPDQPLDKPLDDGSHLCRSCKIKLEAELDDFTNNQ